MCRETGHVTAECIVRDGCWISSSSRAPCKHGDADGWSNERHTTNSDRRTAVTAETEAYEHRNPKEGVIRAYPSNISAQEVDWKTIRPEFSVIASPWGSPRTSRHVLAAKSSNMNAYTQRHSAALTAQVGPENRSVSVRSYESKNTNYNTLTLATANVCTMSLRASTNNCIEDPQLNSRYRTSKEMFHRIHVTVVGIQEGRAKEDQYIHGKYFHIYVAGSSPRGAHGVQLWIHRSFKYTLQTIRVVSPRLIIVMVVAKVTGTRIAFISGHAPHSSEDQDAILEFWTSLACSVQEIGGQGYAVALLIDANARVGSIPSTRLGPFDVESENFPGFAFRGFLETTGMVAFNTFYSCGKTWSQWDGTEHRLDYIGLSDDLAATASIAYIDDRVDLPPGARRDHKLVCAQLQLPIAKQYGRSSVVKRRFSVNEYLLFDPWYCQQFQNAMWSFRPSEYADVDAHLQQLVDFIKQTSLEIFGPIVRRPRQCWMSSLTWSVVSLSDPLRRMQRTVHRILASLRLRTAFRAWLLQTLHFQAKLHNWVYSLRLTRWHSTISWPSRQASDLPTVTLQVPLVS